MKIYNHTDIKTRDLLPLVNFVAARCKTSMMAHLVVTEDPGFRAMNGFAWHRSFDDDHGYDHPVPMYDPTAPSRVTIRFAAPQYPKTTIYRQSVGKVTVRSWQEEFVQVLAHELRHIDQFWSTSVMPREYEVDAERFSHEVLNDWRLEQQRQHRTKPRATARRALAA